MRVIELSKGQVAIVDDEDFIHLAQWKWSMHSQGYASRRRKNGEVADGKVIFMHRAIMSAAKGTHVDHINGNKLDNRRCNLRFATKSQNAANSKRMSNNTTGYRGVCFYKARNNFTANITVGQKTKFLGYFATAEEASIAYKAAAEKHFGEFVRLN